MNHIITRVIKQIYIILTIEFQITNIDIWKFP
jgi:hypothetical protein